MFLKILWLVLFEIPKCNESVVLKKNIPMGGGVKKKSHPWGGHSIFSGTSLSSFTYHINDLLSSHLIDSAPPLSICTSQSLTNIIIPPKYGDNISSINSPVLAVSNSLKLSVSFESSVVLSYKKH